LFKGKARIFKNERPNVVLANRIPGEIFGEITYGKKIVRKVNVVADTDCIFLEINGLVFERLSAEIQNKFRARLLDILVARLDDLGDRYIRDAPSRA
jgi:CRP-like cAMP-binding protein